MRHPFREALPPPRPPWTYLLARAYVRLRRWRWALLALVPFAALWLVGMSLKHAYAMQAEHVHERSLAYFSAAARRYRASNPGRCPSAYELWQSEQGEGEIFSSNDVWGHPFVILCTGSRTEVRAAGLDGLLHTSDDLVRVVP